MEGAPVGVYMAAITPRRDSGHEIDIAAALEIIDFAGEFEIDGISLLGSTGEFLHFDVGERIRFLQMAIKRSRKPVVPNVSHSTLDGTVLLARSALDAGANAVLALPPYYFRYTQQAIRDFYLALVRAVPAGKLVLYNIPFFTTPMDVQTMAALLETGLFAGIKDSSGNYENLEALKSHHYLVGNDAMFVRGKRGGARGVISGVACAAPELMLALDRAPTDTLEHLLAEMFEWLDRYPVPAGLRLALECRGLKVGPHATPIQGADTFAEWFPDWLNRVKSAS